MKKKLLGAGMTALCLLMGSPVWAIPQLQTPEEIAETAARRSVVVMMNEAHSEFQRAPKTRLLGARMLPVLDRHGFKILALEALDSSLAEEFNRTRKVRDFGATFVGYISQPDMVELMQTALDLGWDLAAYEAELSDYRARVAWMSEPPIASLMTFPYTQWREEQQARNLLTVWRLRDKPKMVVWAGNGHISERPSFVAPKEFSPNDRGGQLDRMGGLFHRISGVDPFTIDLTNTVEWPKRGLDPEARVKLELYRDQLEAMGGQGGYVLEPRPAQSPTDATILILDNKME